jgi:hypothetical protein
MGQYDTGLKIPLQLMSFLQKQIRIKLSAHIANEEKYVSNYGVHCIT